MRDVPDEVISGLKERVHTHHRSMRGDVLHILTRASRRAAPELSPGPSDLPTVTTGAPSTSTWTWTRKKFIDE